MQYKILSNQTRFIISALLLYTFLLFVSPVSFGADDPSETIRKFYKLIAKQECEEAIKLRPDYSLQRCKKISKTHIHKVTTELSDDKNAVLLLELDSFYNKKKSYFFGYVRLTKKNGKWIIVGPFKSQEDYWLDEYVKMYIPGEFKGLPEAEKKKKFAPPPAPNISSREESKVLRNDEKMMPPGDSIDAEEFSEPVMETTKIKTNNTPKKPSVEKNSNQLITPEAKALLLGLDAIEGNYTALLIKIRNNFHFYSKGNIILMDKSRRTLYVYNQKNLLLAFFPILSSDNSHFPSGLYRVSSNNPSQLTKNHVLPENQPIILDKIEIVSSEKDSKMTKKLPYYIRDLFDGDKVNSLQLSPIDLNKLYQIVSSSTIVYSGQ